MKSTIPAIEPLESRIAPAVLINPANAKLATYTDIDGDKVTIKISAGAFNNSIFTTVAKGLGDQLHLIDLSDGGFDGANLIISVKKSPLGDGVANIGYINSTGHDLGKVIIAGDLGQIDAGDGNGTGAGIKLLDLRSIGLHGTATQGAGGNLASRIDGSLGALKIRGDLRDASIQTIGAIGSITIGGSIIGGSVGASGTIDSGGDIGSLKIGGDLVGGTGPSSGQVFSTGNLGAVTIGGSIVGGSGNFSGRLQSTDMGAVKIGHHLLGRAGDHSGRIDVSGKLTSLTIGGSVGGGAGSDSGRVSTGGEMGVVKISGDLRGGSGGSSGSVHAGGPLKSVTIAGSLIGDAGSSSGAISSNRDVGPVKIGGDVRGGGNNQSGSVNAAGKLARITIGGSLLGGAAGDTGEIKSGNDMGPVKIGRDMIGGPSVISGIIECAAGNLSSVTIGGSLIGGPASSSGKIVANTGKIGLVKIGHDLVGGSVTGTDFANGTGYIQGRSIQGVTIGGSLVAGIDTSTGTLRQSGSIRAADDLGAVVVKGGIVGNSTTPVIISARGQAAQTATDLAIASVSVRGHVEFAQILAGFGVDLDALNGDAQIGAIKVGGDWIASSASAGVTAGGDGFGNANDALIAGGGNIVARIAAIQIGGVATGTAGAGDHFGFVAGQIGSFKSLGFTAPLTASAQKEVIELSPATGDVSIREV
jgi:hypothetical protein